MDNYSIILIQHNGMDPIKIDSLLLCKVAWHVPTLMSMTIRYLCITTTAGGQFIS